LGALNLLADGLQFLGALSPLLLLLAVDAEADLP
jgi:hypothetical protein